MDMSWLTDLTTKKRSSTFGAYEAVTGDKVVLTSQRGNLVVSPMRSVVSGVGAPARKRSSTWHGAAIQVKQVDNEDDIRSPKSLTNVPRRTAPSLKRSIL